MLDYFGKASEYLKNTDMAAADPLDRKAGILINDELMYEKASQALRRRFVRGATEVDGVDKNGRLTKIKREKVGGKFHYFVLGADGNWVEPEERIWIVAMYALWQDTK